MSSQSLKAEPKLFFIHKKGDLEPRKYTVKEYEELFSISYFATLSFETQKVKDELIANCPWLLLHTVVGQEHRNLGAYLHKSLMSGFVEDVAIKWIDNQIGYGLFAQKLIAKDTFIGQYTGIVRKISRWRPKVNGYCIRVPTKFWSLGSFIIDAESGGNELRFANHSERPNIKPFCLVDRALVHIGFFATRDIKHGEELTFNYGKDFWKYRTKNRSVGCINY